MSGSLSPAGRRNKGAGAERELAGLLRDHLGVDLRRNLDQWRSGGYDLSGLPRLAVEVKRYSTATSADIAGWWGQTCEQAERAGLLPCLAYRLDRQPWRFVVPISLVNEDLPISTNYDMAATMSLDGFCLVVRERFSESSIAA